MYDELKSLLKKHGEVLVVMASGEEVELHLGDTTFDEPTDGIFKVEAYPEGRREDRYYDGDEIESIRLHYSA